MGVEINRLPNALVRQVNGQYKAPAEVKKARWLRKYRAMSDAERKAVDVKTLSEEEAAAFKQVVDEKLAEAFKATQQKAVAEAFKVTPDTPLSKAAEALVKVAAKLTQIPPIQFPPIQINSQYMEKLIQQQKAYWNDGDSGLACVDNNDHASTGTHPSTGDLFVKIGHQTVCLGPINESVITTTPEYDDYDFFKSNYPVPKYTSNVTVVPADPVATAKALGWEPTCGVPDCKNVHHWAKP